MLDSHAENFAISSVPNLVRFTGIGVNDIDDFVTILMECAIKTMA